MYHPNSILSIVKSEEERKLLDGAYAKAIEAANHELIPFGRFIHTSNILSKPGPYPGAWEMRLLMVDTSHLGTQPAAAEPEQAKQPPSAFPLPGGLFKVVYDALDTATFSLADIESAYFTPGRVRVAQELELTMRSGRTRNFKGPMATEVYAAWLAHKDEMAQPKLEAAPLPYDVAATAAPEPKKPVYPTDLWTGKYSSFLFADVYWLGENNLSVNGGKTVALRGDNGTRFYLDGDEVQPFKAQWKAWRDGPTCMSF